MVRPRYSLLSLVLLVLLCASSAALWLHWPAWREVMSFDVYPNLSPDRKLMVLVGPRPRIVDASGRTLHTFEDAPGFMRVIDTDGKRIHFYRHAPKPPDSASKAYWNIQARKWEGQGLDHRVWSPDEAWVVDTRDSEKKLYEVATGRVLRTWNFKDDREPTIYFPPGESQTSAYLVHRSDGTESILEFSKLTGESVWSASAGRVEFSGDGRWVIHDLPFNYTKGIEERQTRSVLVRELSSGKVIKCFDFPNHDGSIWAAADFSQDGKSVVVSPGTVDRAFIHTLQDGKQIELETVKPLAGDEMSQPRILHDIRFVDDDRFIYGSATEWGNPLEIFWDASTGKLVYAGACGGWHAEGGQLEFISYELTETPEVSGLIRRYPENTAYQMPVSGEFLSRDRLLVLDPTSNRYFILERHRPEPLWGILWLPEFWATFLLAVVYTWNFIRRVKPSA